MNKLVKWLDRNDIAHRPTDTQMLMFSGNHADGVYIDGQHEAAVSGYAKRNKGFKWEWRANYTTIYCYGI